MQTFLISPYPYETAKILDNRRLGKQRIEALQILNILIGETKSTAWKNHPAVLMWKGYESFLLYEYTFAILIEWQMIRKFKNEKCWGKYYLFRTKIKRIDKTPTWFSEEFFNSHKSNLIRKNPSYYKKFWPDIPGNLPYIWPVKIGV